MQIAFFSSKVYDKQFFTQANASFGYQLNFLEAPLNERTAVLAKGADAVCVFVNDVVSEEVLQQMASVGVGVVALRCAGFNNVDLSAAQRLGVKVVRVPAYSPYAVAEHAVALMLALNRKVHRAYNRVREGNFSLNGLIGFDMHGKTVGVIGLGKIGLVTANILKGFGCQVLAYDVAMDALPEQEGLTLADLDTIYAQADIITLHCPLTPQTLHLISDDAIAKMKQGVMLINTSRGAIINTQAIIRGLKSEKIGSLGLDVYEEEGDLFFEDLSDKVIQDDVFMRLLTFNNVLITGHQGFLTVDALQKIAAVTLQNLADVERGAPLGNEVLP